MAGRGTPLIEGFRLRFLAHQLLWGCIVGSYLIAVSHIQEMGAVIKFFFKIFFESNGIGGVWFANTHTENLPKLSHQYFSDSIKK